MTGMTQIEAVIKEVLRRYPSVEIVFTDGLAADAYTLGVVGQTTRLYLHPDWRDTALGRAGASSKPDDD